MTTKAKGRKGVEEWRVEVTPSRGDDIPGSYFVKPDEASARAHAKRVGGRVIHLTESDAAELRALRRVARAAAGLLRLKSHRLGPESAAVWDRLERGVMDAKRARR